METLSRSPYVPSLSLSMGGRDSPIIFSPNSESEEWVREWESIQAKELIDSPLIAVDADTSVEEACEVLLSNDMSCIAIKDPSSSSGETSPLLGLFDFADINAFLTLAALQHTKSPEELRENPRAEQIVKAAKAGKVTARLVSNLSEKDPLEILPDTATLVDLLKVFASGTHRILIRSSSSPESSTSTSQFLGFISDRSLLSYFHAQAQTSAPLSRFLNNGLHSLTLPSINLRTAVVSCAASARVLDAMALMSEEGVSSVAVVEDSPASGVASPGQMILLSAVSVTDIGKIVVRSESNQILQMPLQQFVSQIKEPDGSTDGEDRYPVYSVSARSTLRYVIEKILATNAHRVFVTEDTHSGGSSPVAPASPTSAVTTTSQAPLNGVLLRGVVSVVDVLALFAQLAGLPDVDPARMQRHRRFSSASSGSGSMRSPQLKPVGVR
ncbi:SDS23 [Sanghuangporus sanghuang]